LDFLKEARMLAHERLDVYKCSIELLASLLRIANSLPKGHASLADQMKRAGMSVPFNLAEGVGKATAPDQKRYFLIARGSAMECGAILDVCRVMNLVDVPEFDAAKALVERVVSMLTRMGR